MIGLHRPWIDDARLRQWIQEDLGVLDLTSIFIYDNNIRSRAKIISREECIVSCVEEAARVYELAGAERTLPHVGTGDHINPGDIILEAWGDPYSLHIAWRLAQNLISVFSGIATETYRIVRKVREIDKRVIVATTRKTLPGIRPLYIKSIIAGGAVPHRLGLYDSILLFDNHINILGGWDNLPEIIRKIRNRIPHKAIGVEAKSREEAIRAAKAGADIVQIDKVPPDALRRIIKELKMMYPNIIIVVAGNINRENIVEYVAARPDIIVTSSPYYAKPIDMTTIIYPD